MTTDAHIRTICSWLPTLDEHRLLAVEAFVLEQCIEQQNTVVSLARDSAVGTATVPQADTHVSRALSPVELGLIELAHAVAVQDSLTNYVAIPPESIQAALDAVLNGRFVTEAGEEFEPVTTPRIRFDTRDLHESEGG